jgi:hypothetical protein
LVLVFAEKLWDVNSRKKAPITKLQAPEKLQIPNAKYHRCVDWSAAFEVSLEVGAWNLDVLRARL